jgi:CheY-like chemotaxis protein
MAPAVAPRMVTIETDIEVGADDLVKVLVIDDEEDITDSWRRLFEGQGFSVDVANSPEDAILLLKKNHYEMIVADILFENSPLTGDQMIADNPELVEKATVVAITGFGKGYKIKKRADLEKMGVRILEKGGNTDELIQLVTQKLEQRSREVAAVAQASAYTSVREALVEADLPLVGGRSVVDIKPAVNRSGSEYLVGQVHQMLIEWFRSRNEPNKKTIVYAGRTFSANELADEVERGTEIGQEHIEGMIDLFKVCLHIT